LESVAPGKPERRVLAPFVYDSDVLGRRVTVPEGFITDLASVPRLPLAYLLFGGVSNEAAVIHDFLYSGGKVTRKQADDVFCEAMKAEGVAGWRRGPMWLGVRLFGWLHYEKPADTTVAG
jgi:hypothetical protein